MHFEGTKLEGSFSLIRQCKNGPSVASIRIDVSPIGSFDQDLDPAIAAESTKLFILTARK
jgi:hypothetical protein